MIRHSVTPIELPVVKPRHLPGVFGRFEDVLSERIAFLESRKAAVQQERARFFRHMREVVDSDAYAQLQADQLTPPLLSLENATLKYLDPLLWFENKVAFAQSLNLPDLDPISILDLGSGPGHFPAVCAFYGHDVVPTDLPAGDVRRKDIGDLFGRLTRLFGLQMRSLEVKGFESLPDFGQRFDMVSAFLVKFCRHVDGSNWGPDAWAFFLEDVKANVLAPGGSVVMKLIESMIDDEVWDFLAPHAAEANAKTRYLRIETAARSHVVANVPAPAFKSAKRKIHFLHIGKNAGTQIMAMAQHVMARDPDLEIVKHPHSTKLFDLPKDAPYFFSVRDPIARFVSGFYSRKRKGQPRLNVEWSAGEALAFAAFDHAVDLAEALWSPGPKGDLAVQAMRAISHVAAQQSDTFQREGFFLQTRPPLCILRQDSLEDDLQRFFKGLGYQDLLPISDDPMIAHSFDYSTIPALTDTARANLELWYRQDIAFVDLCQRWVLEQSQT